MTIIHLISQQDSLIGVQLLYYGTQRQIDVFSQDGIVYLEYIWLGEMLLT